jgi:hypothetical protein
MATYTAHQGTSRRHHGAIAWTDEHQGATTVAAIAVAVLTGVLLGILFSMVTGDTAPAALHRAGGHALTTVAAAQHAAVAAVEQATGGDVVAARASRTRSPARGGFAVGRTAGAGSGFIVIHTGTRAPVRGGFAGRSLGAGHVPAGALARSTASGS